MSKSNDRQKKSWTMTGERITGAVDMIIEGRPLLKSPGEIFDSCRTVDVVQDRAVTLSINGPCNITFTPAAHQPRALETALMEGLFLARLDVEGETPDRIRLDEGSYYYYVQRVSRRWIGFAVDLRGRLACTTLGVLAKQHIAIHPDEPHPSVDMVLHSIATPEEVDRLFGGSGLGLTAAQDWAEYHTWDEHGVGCIKTIFCSPTT